MNHRKEGGKKEKERERERERRGGGVFFPADREARLERVTGRAPGRRDAVSTFQPSVFSPVDFFLSLLFFLSGFFMGGGFCEG